MPTVKDLGKLVKAKYPEYADMDDVEVGQLVKAKYPEYSDFEDLPTKKKDKEAVPRSWISKVWRGVEKSLAVASDPTARKVLSPLTRQLPIGEERKQKLIEMEKGKDIVYGSDILQELFPGLLEPNPQDMPIAKVGKIGARIGLDVVTDPLTFLGIGLPTKLGRLVKIVHQAKQAGQKIPLTSKAAIDIAKVMGAPKPSARVIQDFMKLHGKGPGKTVSQQIAAGERSILSITPPLGNTGIALPGMTGKVAGAIVKPLSFARRGAVGAKIEAAARDLFSTKSGNPDFDVLITEFRDVAMHQQGLELKAGAEINDKIQSIMRKTGLPRKEVLKNINEVWESIKPITTKGKKGSSIYNKIIKSEIESHYVDKLVDAQVALKNAHRAGDQQAISQLSEQVASIQGELNTLKGSYSPPPSIHPDIDDLVKTQQQRLANMQLDEIASGVDSRPLLADISYYPHITIPEASEAAYKLAKANNQMPYKIESKEFNEFLANSLRRQFVKIKPLVIEAWGKAGLLNKKEVKAILKGKGNIEKLDEILEAGRITPDQYSNAVHTLDASQVNELSRSGQLKSILGDYKGDLFHTDPTFAVTIRGMRGARARAAAEFFTEMRNRQLAIPEHLAPEGWVTVRQKELKGFKVPLEAARVLNKWDEFNSNPEAIRGFFKLYDQFHGLQKVWSLAIFPAYHTLNIVGNFWNNWLGGVDSIQPYISAMKVQNAFGRRGKHLGRVRFRDVFGNKWDEMKIADAAQRYGVVNRGWFKTDPVRTITQELETGRFKLSTFRKRDFIPVWPTSRNAYIRTGLRLGEAIENNARMAHFIDRLRKGDTAEQAATSVKKFLFDYGDLTNTEKKVFNRTFFFYTWTRKNIPLQLHSLVTTPAKYSLPFKAKHEIEKETEGADERFLPEWFKENLPVRVHFNKKTKQYEYFMLNKWLPASDLVKLAHLHEIALQSVSPIPKEVMQQLAGPRGTDFYFKKPIEEFAGETEVFLRKRMPKRASHALKTVRLLNEIDRLDKREHDLFSFIVSTTTGKLYPHDVRMGRIATRARVGEEIKDLNRVMRREKRKGNKDEVQRLRGMIRAKHQEARGR